MPDQSSPFLKVRYVLRGADLRCFFFSSRRRHTRCSRDWSSDVCSSDLLLQGLKERGALVTRVPVYRWGLPQDLAPLRAALRSIADGQVRVVLFTNANQVENVMQVARDGGLDERVRGALALGVVASVGPIASESLRNHGLHVDLEPPHPKMGPLVKDASLRCHEILEAKRDGRGGGAGGGHGPTTRDGAPSDRSPGRGQRSPGGAATAPARAVAALEIPPRPAPSAERGRDLLPDSPFMRACRRETTSVTPVWLMRQAGRYMRE